MEYVAFGWRTVQHGSQALIVDLAGKFEVLDGPCSKFIWRSYFKELTRYVATDSQYLVVKHRDGRVEHLPGPATYVMNPLVDLGASVQKKLTINSGYSIVVYSMPHDSAPGKEEVAVRRNLVHGPQQYTPRVGEWLHRFDWSLPDAQKPGKITPLQFHKLRTVPDQMLFAVDGVRTKDDALLSLKFMIFYHMKDIEGMLENTHDPCGDVCSTLTADTMDFVGQRTFEQFKSESEQLNVKATFPQLVARMEATGYNLIKVAYRGYDASKALQDMHNNAIEKRTGLKLEQETEEQRQELEDMKQQRESQRKLKEQDLESQTQAHEAAVKNKQLEEEIERNKKQFQASSSQKEEAHRLEVTLAAEAAKSNANQEQVALDQMVEKQRRLDELQVAMLIALHEKVGLDVTQYLVAQSEKTDNKIKIVSSPGAGDNATNLHLHSKL